MALDLLRSGYATLEYEIAQERASALGRLGRRLKLLHHLIDFVEFAGLALHHEKPERISRLFDETIAVFPIGISHPRARGKCRQRGLGVPNEVHARMGPLAMPCIRPTKTIEG